MVRDATKGAYNGQRHNADGSSEGQTTCDSLSLAFHSAAQAHGGSDLTLHGGLPPFRRDLPATFGKSANFRQLRETKWCKDSTGRPSVQQVATPAAKGHGRQPATAFREMQNDFT